MALADSAYRVMGVKVGRYDVAPVMAGPLVTKYGVCLETKQRCILHSVGYICTCRFVLFPYLENGWADSAEICCVVRDPLARRFKEVDGAVQVHVRKCETTFHISGTAGRIALKFDVWLGDH